MRDKLKSKDYFDQYIQSNFKRIQKYDTWLENGEVAENRILPVKNGRNGLKVDRLIAMYSRGDEIESLYEEFQKTFQEYIELGNLGVTHTYTENIRFVSLAVLFSLTNEQMITLGSLNLHQDSLMNFLINRGMTEDISKQHLQIEDYKPLYEVIFMSEKDEQSEQLQRFVNDIWYDTNDETGWYESHKSKKVNIYNGYWCFVGAAVAKILNIPDESLKDSQYYPYDLAHFYK